MNKLEQEYMGQIDRPHSIPTELAESVMEYFVNRLKLHPIPPASSGCLDYPDQSVAHSALSSCPQ
jgi:hypothetical protein